MNRLFQIESLYFLIKSGFWISLMWRSSDPLLRGIGLGVGIGLLLLVAGMKAWQKRESRHVEVILLTILLPLEIQLFSFLWSRPPVIPPRPVKWTCPEAFSKNLIASARVLELVHDGLVTGWVITHVEKDGPWARLGIQERDVIEKVGGELPKTSEAFLKSLSRFCQPGFTLEVDRKGRKLRFAPGWVAPAQGESHQK